MATLMSIPPDEAVTAAAARTELVVALTDAAIWLATHPDAELPDCRTLSKRVYGLTYGDKLEHLHRIARSWGVPVETAPDGVKSASVSIGSVRFEAHVSPPDASLADYLARIRKRTAPAVAEEVPAA